MFSLESTYTSDEGSMPCSSSDDGSDYDPESDDSITDHGGDGGSNDEILLLDAQSQLKEEGLDEYLHWHKPKRDASTVQSLAKRYARIIVWLYSYLEMWQYLNIMEVLYHLIMIESRTIEKYYDYLRSSLRFKPSTIYNANEELEEMIEWFCCFRKGRYTDQWAVRESDLFSLRVVIKKSRKQLARERKYVAAIDSSNTVAELVASKKWPVGGLAELNDAVLGQMDWARSVAKQFGQQQDRRIYQMFIELLLASLYTGNLSLIMLL